MRIRNLKCIYIIFSLFVLINCKSFKYINSNVEEYKGEIKILGENNLYLKFKVDIDSTNKIYVKLYNNTGYKVGSFTINTDSISIIDLYDMSYKDLIINVFNKVNKEIKFHNFIVKLVKGNVFENRYDIIRNKYCIEEGGYDKDIYKMDILSRNCNKLFEITAKKNFNKEKNKNFEIIVSKELKIEILVRPI